MGYDGKWNVGNHGNYESKESNLRYGLDYANLISALKGQTITVGKLRDKIKSYSYSSMSLYDIEDCLKARRKFYNLFDCNDNIRYQLCYEIEGPCDNGFGVLRYYDEVPEDENLIAKESKRKFVSEEDFKRITSASKGYINLYDLVGRNHARDFSVIGDLLKIKNLHDEVALDMCLLIDKHTYEMMDKHAQKATKSLGAVISVRDIIYRLNRLYGADMEIFCVYENGSVKIYDENRNELFCSDPTPLYFDLTYFFTDNPLSNGNKITDLSEAKLLAENLANMTDRCEEIESYINEEIKRAEQDGDCPNMFFYGSY